MTHEQLLRLEDLRELERDLNRYHFQISEFPLTEFRTKVRNEFEDLFKKTLEDIEKEIEKI